MITKSRAELLTDADGLRSRVTPTITLPDFDLGGVTSIRCVSNMIDALVELERSAGNCSTHEPFAEQRSDTPGVVWLRQPGLLMDIIATWAERQLELVHAHIERMKPENGFEEGEREVLLLTWYARRGEFTKAVSLLAGHSTQQWPNAEQMASVVDAATDGRNRLEALVLMVEGSSLPKSEKNAFHQVVRATDECFGGVEGALHDMHEIAKEAA